MISPVELQAHCAEIERCNQRGGRMLSIVDLLEAGTFTPELAAYALAVISRGASFLVGALPGGAGKTTVMGALLNFVPREVPLVTVDSPAVIAAGLTRGSPRRCYFCHEISPAPYYAYLWGELLRGFFELPKAGHMLAGNLHADTWEQAHAQICVENGVPLEAFRRVNLLFFLAVQRQGAELVRRIVAVWESDGASEHRLVFDDRAHLRGTHLVNGAELDTARGVIDRLMRAQTRGLPDVRSLLARCYL